MSNSGRDLEQDDPLYFGQYDSLVVRRLDTVGGNICNAVENLPVCSRAAALVFLNYSASEMYIMI